MHPKECCGQKPMVTSRYERRAGVAGSPLVLINIIQCPSCGNTASGWEDLRAVMAHWNQWNTKESVRARRRKQQQER